MAAIRRCDTGIEMIMDSPLKSDADGNCDLCPLSAVKAGVQVRIRRLCAAPETQDRLREIGFCEEQIIRLLTSQNNFICQVCNSRLAISEQLAKLILVEPVPVVALAR